jgi:phosphoribosyl-AMP cyclohydrolase
MPSIVIIYQNERTNKITDLVIKESFIYDNQFRNVYVDCDEDSFLVMGDFSENSGIMEIDNNLDSFFLKKDLAPVVAIDEDGQVMMQAFANKEALRLTIETGFGHYFSRSRKKLWKKGEDSGHLQKIVKIEYSPIGEFFIYTIVQQIGACHTGYYSCFYRKQESNGNRKLVFSEKKFEPDNVYG